jgi:hypothetical protein
LIRSSLRCVLPSVEFYDDAMLEAAKVDDEGADRILAAEFSIAKLSRTEARPQFFLRVGLITTQAAGSLLKNWRAWFQLIPLTLTLSQGRGNLLRLDPIQNQKYRQLLTFTPNALRFSSLTSLRLLTACSSWAR